MRAAAFRPLAFLCALAMHGGCTHGRGSAALEPTPTGTLAIAQHVDHLDVMGREPMLVEHPDGSLFVAGYGEPRPTLWKSHDRGVTWNARRRRERSPRRDWQLRRRHRRQPGRHALLRQHALRPRGERG